LRGDINSGVEASPGKKDPYKIREIMEIIRAVDMDEAPGNIFTDVGHAGQTARFLQLQNAGRLRE